MRNSDRKYPGRPGFRKPQQDKRPGASVPSRPSGPKINANIYGFHALAAAWINPERDFSALYLTEPSRAGFEPVLAQAAALGLKRPAPVTVEKADLDRALPDSVHQGLAGQAGPPPESAVSDMVSGAQIRHKTLILLLDQVTDPHNVGAILRSACAFGANGVVMQRKHAPGLENPVLAKTACGAADHIPVAYETNLARALEQFKAAGFFVLALDERGEKSFTDLPDYEKSVLVLGAEGPGLRRLVREGADILVRLPTSGPIGSLNVSNAAAVALYALTARGRKQA